MSAADTIAVARLEGFAGTDLADLCDAAETAIIDGGGFGWLNPPPRDVMERFWKGVLLVPERELWVARREGRIIGSSQLVRAPRNNEAQSRIATITMTFVAPWARRHGAARALVEAVEKSARAQGLWFVTADLRATQTAAIALYESLGYQRWGTNPNYAVVEGRIVPGHYFSKQLRGPRGGQKRAGDEP